MSNGNNQYKQLVLVWHEVTCDYLCYVYMLKALYNVKNIHANNYVALFLKTIAPVLEIELEAILKNANANNGLHFFNPGNRPLVYNQRQHSLKEVIVSSSKTPVAEKSMELSFNEKVYDIRLKMHNNTLLDLNYETVLEDIQLSDFWQSVLSAPERVLEALLEVFNSNISKQEMFRLCNAELSKTAESIDKEFSSEWFSYSIYKLFSKSPSLQRKDKIFIMYRYRFITSILKIEKLLPSLTVKNNEYKIDIFACFFRKWKAVIIEVIWNELKDLHTEFSQSLKNDLNKNITDTSFFSTNRKLRDNIHYERISALSDNDIMVIDKYQPVYFNVVINAFENAMFIDIDDECRSMTAFVNACYEKGVSPEMLPHNYETMYKKFLRYNTI